MFGLANNDDQNADNDIPTTSAPTPVFASNQSLDVPDTSQPTTAPQLNPMPPTPAAPPQISPSLPNISTDTANPQPEPSMAPTPEVKETPEPISTATAIGSSDDQLFKMKQQALQSLAPLVDHLEQTPEEKFRTTMMLIQASDNPDLVKEAFEAANQIKDDKARAQALLDVVNEINYFTHKNAPGGQKTS